MTSSIEKTQDSASIDAEKAAAATPPKDGGDDEFPPPRKLIPILVALYLSMFVVALVGAPEPSIMAAS